MIKKVIFIFYHFRKRFQYYKKINGIYLCLKKSNILKNIDQSVHSSHKKIWRQLDKHFNCRWLKVYSSISGITDERYIPETIYYTKVEPILNDYRLVKAYADKNFYDKFYKLKLFPSIILRNIDGQFFTCGYNFFELNENKLKDIIETYSKIVVKPSIDSGGGYMVRIFHRSQGKFSDKNGNILTKNFLDLVYKKNYLIQKYIEQHAFFSQFNPSSLNTVRIFTYRSVKNDKVYPLKAVLRIGSADSEVDNQASGGIAISINVESGELNSFAVNKNGEKLTNTMGLIF